MAEITNREELAAWLVNKPPGFAGSLAARSALRVAPLLQTGFSKWPGNRQLDGHVIRLLRCILTAGVAAVRPTPEVRRAAAKAAAVADNLTAEAFTAGTLAAAAAYHAADVFSDAAATVTTVAYVEDAFSAHGFAAEAAANASEVWDAVSADATYLEIVRDPEIIFSQSLWYNGAPNWLSHVRAGFADTMHGELNMPFWARWFQAMHDGRPLNWEMQKEIALIPERDWEKGAAQMAPIIAEIEARYAKPKLPPEAFRRQAEELVARPVPTTMSAEGIAAQIETALEAYATETGANQLPPGLEVLEMMPRTLRAIAVGVSDHSETDDRISELEALVEKYAAENAILVERLKEAEENFATGILKTHFLEQAGKSLGDWKFYAALLSGGYVILGGEIFGHTASSLGEAIRDFIKPGPPATPPSSPTLET